jgi:hypothetical protein
VFVLRQDQSIQGCYAFGDISHCAFILPCDDNARGGGSAVQLVLYQNQTGKEYKNLNPFDLPFDLKPPFLGFFEGGGNTGSSLKRLPQLSTSQRNTDSWVTDSRVTNTSITSQENIVEVQCNSREIAIKLYTALASCSKRMGSPSNVLSLDIAIATLTPSTSAHSMSDSLSTSAKPHLPIDLNQSNREKSNTFGGYRFGEANHVKHTPTTGQSTEKDVLNKAARRLFENIPYIPNPTSDFDSHHSQYSESYTIAKALDERVWSIVSDWRGRAVQQQLQSSRCLAVLIINQSKNPIQILRTDVLEGRNVLIFSAISSICRPGKNHAAGYDEESRTLMGGGGAATVFAFGFLPSPIDPAHVQVNITTTAFNAIVSTRPNRTSCVAIGGYMSGYHEKSLGEQWAKYAIIVN